MSKEGSIEKGDGGDFIVPHNLFSHVECWMGEARGKALRKGFWLVWHATIWVIWCARNDKVFNNITKGGEELVEEVKVLSWTWNLHRLKTSSCMFYEWCWDPGSCLKR